MRDCIFSLEDLMKPKKRAPRRRNTHAAPLFDDGVPVDPFTSGDTKEGRKAKQLCRQVAETLDMILSGECHDETLQSLHVLSVVPAPNASRLLVIARADLPEEQFDRDAIMAQLDAQSGRLRAEIAASIHRKRTPLLTFHVIGPTWMPEAM
jgi:ribosome-binding factor A